MRPKKLVLFQKIGRVKIFEKKLLTHRYSRMCITRCIFNFIKHQTNKQKKQEPKKAKEAKEEKIISPENLLKKIAVTW